ncbi:MULTISPECIES: hypothetical protein [Paenibacillus]|uniref:hypothetical protein n=1 Tax=Paenibacillus TaxID=44249 RepID=UPI001595709D|nr:MULTISPECIES: hypothetical protein [Paenibacillus]
MIKIHHLMPYHYQYPRPYYISASKKANDAKPTFQEILNQKMKESQAKRKP